MDASSPPAKDVTGSARETLSFTDCVVLPGLIDMHAHPCARGLEVRHGRRRRRAAARYHHDALAGRRRGCRLGRLLRGHSRTGQGQNPYGDQPRRPGRIRAPDGLRPAGRRRPGRLRPGHRARRTPHLGYIHQRVAPLHRRYRPQRGDAPHPRRRRALREAPPVRGPHRDRRMAAVGPARPAKSAATCLPTASATASRASSPAGG